ncbi:MAG: hypothetical protein GY696_30875 [Gammaproteobacteria bacterium]|nr:hypothetical protein [Gammaproteobacteria bacterium]
MVENFDIYRQQPWFIVWDWLACLATLPKKIMGLWFAHWPNLTNQIKGLGSFFASAGLLLNALSCTPANF